MAHNWPRPLAWVAWHSTCPAPAAHARSAATARPGHGNAHPSQTDLGPLACLGSTCGIALTLARLGDQFPQAGLQRRPTAGVAQPSTRKLFGLDGITLRSEEHTSELQSREKLVC